MTTEDLGGKFIFIITLLGVFALLLGMIYAESPELFAEAPEYRQADIPEYFGAIDIQHFGDTEVLNITSDPFDVDWELGGQEMHFRARYGSNYITNTPFGWVLWWKAWGSKMHWLDRNGIDRGDYITKEILKGNYDEQSQTSDFIVQAKTFEVKAFFAYNTTLWSDIDDAWANDDLHVLMAVDFDEMKTGMNAWNIISMILFFQLPNIHPVLNAIIALPLWAGIVYLTVRLILMFIDALPFT